MRYFWLPLLFVLSTLGCTRSSDFVMDPALPPAQKTSAGVFEGRVVNAQGAQGLPNVTVNVISKETGAVVMSTRTDSQGAFTIPGIRPGMYGATFARSDLARHAGAEITIVSDRRTFYQTVMSLLPGRLEGTVTDALTRAPLAGVKVSLSNGMVTYTDGAGKYYVADLPAGNYAGEFSLAGYLSALGQRAVIVGGQTTVLDVRLSKDLGVLTGHVSNALNGQPLPRVHVSVRTGPGTPLVADTFTDGAGNYTVRGLPAGSYTVDFELNGFVPLLNISTSITESQTTVLDVVMTPVLAEDQYRIVMSWTRTKHGAVRDVDSYLMIPGHSRTVDFNNRNDGNGANLDVDDTDWMGPETITITQRRPGTYRYYVDNYNMRCEPTFLGNSEIVVRVFKGASLLKTYNVPPGRGLRYEVLNIVDGNLVDIERYDDSLPVQGSSTCSPPKPIGVENQFLQRRSF